MTDKSQEPGTQSRTDRKSAGKALREQSPRGSHGDWTPAPDRPDPLGLLQAQDEGRLEHLLPIKYGRMLESPFARAVADFAVAYAGQTERGYSTEKPTPIRLHLPRSPEASSPASSSVFR